MKRLLMSAALLLGACLAAQSIPTLPEGAYPEWSSQKAWQRHSATRSQVCLNGLWQFASEQDFTTVTTKTLFADDLDGDPATFCSLAPDAAPNASATASPTTTTHSSSAVANDRSPVRPTDAGPPPSFASPTSHAARSAS